MVASQWLHMNSGTERSFQTLSMIFFGLKALAPLPTRAPSGRLTMPQVPNIGFPQASSPPSCEEPIPKRKSKAIIHHRVILKRNGSTLYASIFLSLVKGRKPDLSQDLEEHVPQAPQSRLVKIHDRSVLHQCW